MKFNMKIVSPVSFRFQDGSHGLWSVSIVSKEDETSPFYGALDADFQYQYETLYEHGVSFQPLDAQLVKLGLELPGTSYKMTKLKSEPVDVEELARWLHFRLDKDGPWDDDPEVQEKYRAIARDLQAQRPGL